MNLDEQNAMLRRAKMCLEDEEWSKVEELTEHLLNSNPELSEAYLLKFLTAHKVKSLHEAAAQTTLLKGDKNLERALKFADSSLRKEINQCIENNRLNLIYVDACDKLNSAKATDTCDTCQQAFMLLGDFKDSKNMLKKCTEKKAEITATNQKKSQQQAKNFKITKIALYVALFTALWFFVFNSTYKPPKYDMNTLSNTIDNSDRNKIRKEFENSLIEYDDKNLILTQYKGSKLSYTTNENINIHNSIILGHAIVGNKRSILLSFLIDGDKQDNETRFAIKKFISNNNAGAPVFIKSPIKLSGRVRQVNFSPSKFEGGNEIVDIVVADCKIIEARNLHKYLK